jgi:hypothetical protein
MHLSTDNDSGTKDMVLMEISTITRKSALNFVEPYLNWFISSATCIRFKINFLLNMFSLLVAFCEA